MTERRHTILLENDVAVDPRKYGDLVAPALGVTKVEARMAVRKGRGIFLENLAEDHARRIAAELERDGIATRVLAKETIPAMPAVRKVTQLEHGEDLLSYRVPGSDEQEAVPWDAVLVAQAGVVAKSEFKDLFGHVPFEIIPPIHKMDGGERELIRENLILKMETRPPDRRLRNDKRPDSVFEEVEQKYGTKVRVYADVVTADLGLWLRVPLDEIAYLYMADSVRMGGPWGFQLLINDLREKCAPAFTETTLKLLEAVDIKEHVFPQVEEYNRYITWVALKRVLPPAGDTSSPSPAPPESSTESGSSSASSEPAPPSTSS